MKTTLSLDVSYRFLRRSKSESTRAGKRKLGARARLSFSTSRSRLNYPDAAAGLRQPRSGNGAGVT
jgi:hypothetical protein